LFHLFLFFHLSIGLLLFVCARAGEEKKTPLLVVCPCGFKAEGRRKIEAEGRRKISAAFSSQQRTSEATNNNEPSSRRRGFRE